MKNLKNKLSIILVFVMLLALLPINQNTAYALDKSDSSTELENLYAKVTDRSPSGWQRKDCDPKFDPATKRYTIAVEQNYTDIYFYIGWANDGQVFEVKKDGNPLTLANAANGFTTDTKSLNEGSTEFAFKVTSKDKTKSDTYYVTVIKGDVANLKKITVKNGTANKTMAFAGDYINIYADPAPVGKVFKIWERDKNDISFTRIADASTGFTMPDRDVTVEAIYKTDPETSAELDDIVAKLKKSTTTWETKNLNPVYDRETKSYTLTVDKDYNTAYFYLAWDDKDQTIVAKKDGVNLKLDPPLSSGYETIVTDLTNLETVFTFEVTSKDKKNTNTYTVKVKRGNAADLYNVDVVNGTANPNPAYVGDIVYIDANSAPQGKVFDYWQKDGNDITILNPTEVSTRFKMPARNVKVEAIYKIDPAVSAELKDIKAYVSGPGIAWDTLSITPNYDRATKEYTLAIPNKYNVIYFFLAWDDEGQKIVAKKDGVDLGLEDKLSTGYNTKNAGFTDKASVYTFEVTSKDGKSTNTYKVTVTREASPLTPVNIPTANTNLVYNGSTLIGVNEGTGYTLTDNTATNAGTYTAKATLEAGYKWSDGSTEVKNISFEIKKARPTYTEPENLTGKKGDKLSTVTLPAQFKWKNGDITLDTVGDNTYYAEFTPTDTTNYEVIDVDLTVTVEDVEHNITVVNGTSSAPTAKQGESVTVTAAVPADKEFDAWEVTGITLTDAQKKENPLIITMPDNDITLTAKFKDGVKLTNIKIKALIGSGWQDLNPPLPYNESTKEYTLELENKIDHIKIELTCDTSKLQATLKQEGANDKRLDDKATYYISEPILMWEGKEEIFTIELSKDGSVVDKYVLKITRKNKELIEIDLPIATLSFVYDGTEKVAIQEGTGYTLSNHKATEAGEYKPQPL